MNIKKLEDEFQIFEWAEGGIIKEPFRWYQGHPDMRQWNLLPSEVSIDWLPTKCVDKSTFGSHPGYSHSECIEHIEMLTSWESYEFVPKLFKISHSTVYV